MEVREGWEVIERKKHSSARLPQEKAASTDTRLDQDPLSLTSETQLRQLRRPEGSTAAAAEAVQAPIAAAAGVAAAAAARRSCCTAGIGFRTVVAAVPPGPLRLLLLCLRLPTAAGVAAAGLAGAAAGAAAGAVCPSHIHLPHYSRTSDLSLL